MTLRRPAVAGTFYPADASQLKQAINASYTHRLGPGRLALEEGGRAVGVRACVSPHAGYAYSGPIAAHSYLELSKFGRPDVVVIAGPNHYGVGSGVAAYGEGEWETPLGRATVDQASTNRLIELTGIVDVDREAHKREHSIEVQLPFLQLLYGEAFSFLPVSLAFQDKATARDLGGGVAELVRGTLEEGKSVVLVASSDLTHYEPAPQAREKDASLLRHIERLDLDSFYTTLERRSITACGYGAIGTVMEACKLLGFTGARVNAYATSGDVTGDNAAVVGYPSVSFVE